MAHPDGTSARTHRLIGLAATVLLAVTTALAFGRVFLGAAATFRLLAVAVASGLIAVALERRSLLLATVASAIGAAIAVGLAVFPSSTWYGVPTADTLHAALDAARVVGEQARIQIAPAEPIAPLMLAAVVSLWAAIFSAHALAFRAGSPLLGLIPPVALVAFADTVLEQFVKPLYGLAFLVAALLVVFADGLARVQGWGPIWSSSRRGVAAGAARGARRLGVTAVAAALIAPILVPGFGSKAVIDLGSGEQAEITLDPFVSVQNELTRRDPVDVFHVQTPIPTYLRLISLPIYNGTGWTYDHELGGQPVEPGAALPRVGGLLTTPTPMRIDVLHDLGVPWLPAPYPTQSIDAPSSSVSYDPETGTAFVAEPLREGDRYVAEALLATPTADELRAERDAPGFGQPPAKPDADLALPQPIPGEIEQLAHEWTAGAPTVYDRAVAIQERFQEDFRYDEHAQLGSGPDVIERFLTSDRAGFCQQFAASMALMLRTLDIPARVVVGFATGRRVRDGYVIASDRAHAWVEVRFPHYGWLPFEPTPGRSNPVTQAYDAPAPACRGADCPKIDTGQGSQRGVPKVGPGQQGLNDFRRERVAGRFAGPPRSVAAPEPDRFSARIVLLIAAILAGIGYLLTPVVRAARRRLRRRQAAQPRTLILVTYEQFTEQAAGVGLGRAPGETFEEYRRKVLGTGYLADGELDRLTRIATAAAYSPRAPGAEDVTDAARAAETALAEIRRAVGPGRWLTGLYRRG